jgi:site-specific DNA recombinase
MHCMRTVGIYARVSTDEQAEVREGGTKNQVESLQKYVQGENVKSDGTWGVLIDTYIDDGFSAKNLNRPNLKRLLVDIAKGKVDTVLITEISRLSRSVKDWIHLREFFKDRNANFISTRQSFDTSSATGRAMLDFAITFAQLEREQTAERVKASYHARTSRGLWPGGPVPYGLDLTDRPGQLDLNPAKQLIADNILDILLNQAGYLAKTVELIEQEGYKREDGQPWDEKSLARWIRSRALIGEIEQNQKNKDKDQATLPEHERYKIVPAVWEPVVDKDKWQRANDLLDQNHEKLKVPQWKHHEYILTGLVECQSGTSLTGSSGWGRSGQKYCSYRHRDKSSCGCGIKPVASEMLEKLILRDLRQLFRSKEALEQLVRAANKDFEKDQPDYAAAMASARKRLDGVKRRLSGVLDEILAAAPDEKRTWIDKRKTLESERDSVEAEIQEIDLRSKDRSFGKLESQQMLSILRAFDDKFDELPIASKQAFLRAIVERIIIRPGKVEIVLRNPGFSIDGGNSGRKKTTALAFSTHDSGDQTLAQWDKWGGGRRGVLKSSPHPRIHLVRPFVKSYPLYMNKQVLAQKYIEERLSMKEIAKDLGTARSTISKYLRKHGIPLRTAYFIRKRIGFGLAYGKRIVSRQEVAHKREMENIARMRNLREKGFSYWKIADALNALKVPTKTGRARWHARSIQQILDAQEPSRPL